MLIQPSPETQVAPLQSPYAPLLLAQASRKARSHTNSETDCASADFKCLFNCNKSDSATYRTSDVSVDLGELELMCTHARAFMRGSGQVKRFSTPQHQRHRRRPRPPDRRCHIFPATTMPKSLKREAVLQISGRFTSRRHTSPLHEASSRVAS